jgi:hypothetical protein
MVGFALAGVVLAIGHHRYYSSLHLSPSGGVTRVGSHNIPHQIVTNFVATLFIFVVKLCLGQSVSKAFDQRLWYTVRRTSMKLGALDALFGVLSDPIAFLNFEMMWRAKLAAALAFIAWTGTFAVIPVPGSLTVQSIETRTTQDVSVSTVNLAKEPASGLIYTFSPISVWFPHFALHSRFISATGSYVTAGPIVQTVANKALLEADIAQWPSPCGPSCSYNVTFFAPTFSCSASLSSAIQARVPIWSVPPLIKGETTDTLTVRYISNFQTNTQSQTNCTSFNSTYIVAVEFRDNQQNVKLLDLKVGPSFGTGSTIIIDDPTCAYTSSTFSAITHFFFLTQSDRLSHPSKTLSRLRL